ncbi:PREDICTED: zinc finger BED domain-containing protein RICESLEEPER 3-like isoform X11 [Lupinus angustifolius]|uniref:zinc finger BED domain-containing protein RICESLEEPER 3-like isoform X11 n=1 Tax=Lupinus angustifolius TaxID=3871 RepID=UPI00092F968C|nr:PREDICTED: zinc finger BED domain-containing protein RICESLEEPER 3-like isoform X11 [Lupinus angustifolius]
MVATLEEDKAMVTPEVKKDPISADGQPSNDIDQSETLPGSNVENSESETNKDLSDSGIQASKEVTASDTLTTSAEAGTLPNHESGNSEESPSNHPDNSEPIISNQPVNAEAVQNSQAVNSELQTSVERVVYVTQQSSEVVISETQQSNEVAVSETQQNNEMVVSEPQQSNEIVVSETQQSDEVVFSEIQQNKEVTVSETQQNNEMAASETQQNNEMVVSETQQSNEVVFSEAQQSNEVFVSETQQSNEVVLSETQQSNEVVVSETQQSNEVAMSEAQPSGEVVVSETQPTDEVVVSETQPTDEVVVSETQPTDEVVVSETQPTDEVVVSETQPTDEVVVSETQPTDEVVVSETQPTDEVVVSETQQSNEVVVSESHQSNEMVVSEAHQTSGEVVVSETQISNEVPVSEFQPNNEVVVSEFQPNNEVDVSEIQQNNEVPTQPRNELVMSDTQPNDEANMPETQTCDDLVMSEAIPENELANSTTDPNNQHSHSETLHDNQFTNFHMIPEDQLPQLESLPHSEPPPSSELPTDDHLTDIKPLPHNHLPHYEIVPNNHQTSHNHLPHYESVPNNHLNHSEAFSNNHLANYEALSHDQIGNSEMFTHYELENNETMHNNQLANSHGQYELAVSNALPSYEIINAETPLNTEERTPETQPSKRRKKKSIVWEHFSIEAISPGCRRARCNQCRQTFAYSTGSKVAGTSHLKRHVAKGTCSAILRSQDNQLNPYTPRSRGSGAGNTTDPPKRRYRSPSTPYVIFDQDHCRHEIARMIIMHDYPLHMVEHPGFVAFVQNLQPQFKMVTFNTIQGDCIATYLMEKQNLLKYFEGLPGRVCLTLDTWTSSQSLGYVFITGHFVDNDWKLQRRTLNVVMEPYPDSDSALSHSVAACLSDWGLEGRLFSVTCNQTMNAVALENLRPLLSVKNPHILNGQLLVGNCIARTLSSVAKDLLGSVQDIVNKVRDSVKYVKTSESHEEKFMELKQQLQVPSEKSLFIDDQIQWNTTYQMLVAASELKEVFSCLDTSDPDYKGAPSMHDWKLVETLCAYLKPLFDAGNILTAATHPTAITFFHEVWKLHLDVGRAVMSEDPFVSNINKIMHERIDKYWRDCSLVLALAVVMDPRFKMKLVEFSFTKIYGDNAHEYVKFVEDGIHELFHEYVSLPLPLTPAYAEERNAGSNEMEVSPGGTLLSDNGLTDFDAYIMETTSQQTRSELDQYLEESLLPRVPNFDVLGWWKLNKVKYPTLSKMARDILSIPVSAVQSDSVFYTNNKEMDHYRSSLRPETVEALVCAKDWMQYGAAEASNALVKMVF